VYSIMGDTPKTPSEIREIQVPGGHEDGGRWAHRAPDRTFDLGKPFMLRSLYETVLREANRPEGLTTYLNGDTLLSVWPDLYLPKGVRQAWEDQHPGLRAARAAVA
jgi:hypothetical protein